MHVGWIGLGRVGMQMALVTLAAGHEVTGHSRSFDRHAEVMDPTSLHAGDATRRSSGRRRSAGG